MSSDPNPWARSLSRLLALAGAALCAVGLLSAVFASKPLAETPTASNAAVLQSDTSDDSDDATTTAVSAPALSSMVVGIDPETGELGAPGPGFSASMPAGIASRLPAPRSERRPDGTVVATPGTRALVFSVARVDADGELMLQHGEVDTESGAIVAAGAPSVGALER